MMKYSAKKGLKIFKKRGVEAVVNEFKQLHERDTFEPQHYHELTKEQRDGALPSLMFLKEKRYERIKGRACADNRKQSTFTTTS